MANLVNLKMKILGLLLSLGTLLPMGLSEALPVPTNSVPQVIQTGPSEFQIGAVHFSRNTHTLSFPAEINLVDRVVEYGIVSREGKTHESLLRTDAAPRDVHLAVLLLGGEPTADLGKTNKPIHAPLPSRVNVDVEWALGGVSKTNRLSEWLGLGTPSSQTLTGRLQNAEWAYSGSLTLEGHFIAQEEGSILSLIRDPNALINNLGIDRDNDDIHYPDPRRMPPKGTPVTVRLQLSPPAVSERKPR